MTSYNPNEFTPESAAISAIGPLFAWAENPTPILPWSSDSLQVKIGEGSGQLASPFSIIYADFQKYCILWGFSPKLFRKVTDRASCFEHVFHVNRASPSRPTCLEILMAIYENDALFCLFRYDMTARTAKCLLFVKRMDYPGRRKMPASRVKAWLESHRDLINQHPLMMLTALLGLMQSQAHGYLEWRKAINNLESRLGVTKYASALKEGNYDPISYDFEDLNAEIGGLTKRAADNELSVSTILEHARALKRLVEICEKLETPPELAADRSLARPESFVISEHMEEIQSTITRAEMYLKFTKMVHTVLQSQAAVLYNRINKQDSQSMKTIAVVTLFFLPATFVSVVFASGVFNFQTSNPDGKPRTVSRFAWVYLLVCLLATIVTLILWVIWYIWGRQMLEKSRFSRLGGGNSREEEEEEANAMILAPFNSTSAMQRVMRSRFVRYGQGRSFRPTTLPAPSTNNPVALEASRRHNPAALEEVAISNERPVHETRDRGRRKDQPVMSRKHPPVDGWF